MGSRDALHVVMRRFGQRVRIRNAVRLWKKGNSGEPKVVEIMTFSGVAVRVEKPCEWLRLFDDVYLLFKDEEIGYVVAEWCDSCKSATVVAELNAMTRRVFYERSKVFFGLALGLAVERKLVRF